jgi:hypothetical protein
MALGDCLLSAIDEQSYFITYRAAAEMSDPYAGFDVVRESRAAEKITMRFHHQSNDFTMVDIEYTLID